MRLDTEQAMQIVQAMVRKAEVNFDQHVQAQEALRIIQLALATKNDTATITPELEQKKNEEK